MSVIQRAAERMREQRRDLLVAPTVTPGGIGSTAAAEAPPVVVAPVVVTIPPAPPPRRSREITLDFRRLGEHGFITPGGRQSRLAEEIRLIKRRLAQRGAPSDTNHPASRLPQGQVILVTSARPQEGKSFVALNLALSFALDDGLDALLIDADSQRPSVLQSLGLASPAGPPPPGLTDLLCDPGLDIADMLLRDHQVHLSVLPAGRPLPSATNLFAQERTRAWIAETARRYADRVIIFDAPPILSRTEPLALAHQVNQVLLVVEAGRTSAENLKKTLDLLAPADNVSLILNQMLSYDRDSGFGRYYNEDRHD